MVRSPAMAVVKPFRAVRYDEDVAGPLDPLYIGLDIAHAGPGRCDGHACVLAFPA